MADTQIHKSTGALPEFAKAACQGMPVELFIAGEQRSGGPPSVGDRSRVDQARLVCMSCPERKPCAEYAIANPMMLGVWGGTTFKEREAIRGRRAAGGRT